ncbi:hemagglutinin repeat-containing protein [Pseudomonas fluorescens group sp. PF-1]
MDVRHFAFLARQPSAVVKTRERFCGMPKRGLAFLLANVMFWQPVWAQADGIVVATPGTTLDHAGNGVQIINIATPNGSGLSHNQFVEYNVSAQGLILNNGSTQTSATQLGGIIIDNPHLKNSGSAQAILNEVIGGSPSQLRGYTEVAGQSARVIVANPYGITCNGCGFINTPRVTLTTGKPVLDGGGRLDRFQVDQGSVSIEGDGLNADNIDRFEIITRSAKINAEIQAKNLTIVTGRNDVNADSLNATARAEDGSAKPQLAIDSSALGGMYAGAIKLVGTEAGVGVKLAGNLAASGGDIQIDANGHLSLVQTSAAGAVSVKAASLETQGAVYGGSSVNVQTQGNLTIQQTVAARDSVALSAGGQLTNNGIIEAGVNADNSRNANGDVSLSAQTLDNTGKTVVASRNLTVNTAQTLTNQGGTLSAAQAANMTAGTLDNQNNGRVLSNGSLNLTANQVLNGSGLITSTGQLSATLGHLNNRNGELSSLATATLRMATLDNVAGLVNAGQVLSITATGLVNNQNGKLTSLDSLNVNAGKVDNSNKGRIASNKALTATINSLDQHDGGQLTSGTLLTLDLNHGELNNQNGLINAPVLVLKNLAQVDNRSGEISSAQAFTLAADSLDNSNGKLVGNQAVTLRVQQALTNLKGLIAAANVDVQAGSLNNNGGTLTSRADVALQVNGQLDNQDQGLINAAHNLSITAAGLNNQSGGSLLGSAIAIDFSGAMGDLNNAKGLITTTGQLSIRNLRDLNNQGGELSSSQSYTLTGRNLDNSDGMLFSRQQLDVTAETTTNLNGLISGWQGVSLLGGSLDNRNRGTLSSRDGDVLVDLTGAVRNGNEGALVSHGTLKVTAASLDNSEKGILSSGGAQTFVIAGTLDNSQGGLIDSGAGLGIQATFLNNANATINAQQGISFTGTDLNNGAGSLAGNGAVTLDLLGTLTNTNGQLASLGPLVITRANQIDNQGGKLASQGLLNLLTGGLDNRNGGTVAANKLLTLTASGTVQNSANGLIFSRDAGLTLNAASLDNAKGSLQSQGDLTVKTSGAIDNQSGRIVAKDGNLDITAASLDSRGGVLSSLQGAFSSHITGVLRNGYDLNNNRQGGIIQAQSLDLKALAGIDNYGGRITAQTGDAIVDAGTNGNFDNRNGGLYAKGLVSVTAKDFDNSGDNDGQIAGQQVDLSLRGALNNRLGIIESESTLTITAASLDNHNGQLRALGSNGKTSFTIGGLFDNRNGTVESANNDLTLGAGGLLNVGGNVLHVGTGIFDIATGLLGSAGGNFVTRAGLTLTADGWTNSSVIQADRLTVNINSLNQTASGQLLAVSTLTGNGGNWNNDGLIASDDSLSLTLGGTYSGNGRVSSLGTFGLSAAQLNVSAAASIAGGGDTTVSVGGQLNNAGRLTSAANLTVSAGGLYNTGTLGSGQGLTVTTGSVVNDHGLIFSGGNMSLRVNALNNSYANIYSLGNLTIDRNGQGAQADSIVNSSASIQSDGSMSLAASTIQNIRAVLTTSNQGIYTAKIDEITCIEGVNAGDCSGKQNHAWEIVQRDKFEVTEASAASSITAGGNLALSGGDLLNQSSTIATGGNLSASLVNLTNSGIETGETETTRVFRSERTRNASGWYSAASNFTDKYWFESAGYNPNDLGGLEAGLANFIGMTEMEYPNLGSSTKIASSDQSYAAVIQAAGAVNINAQNNIDNSVVRPGYTYVGSGPRTGTGASGSQFSTRITLNQQLPPDLAQQQVNPVSLPGFSLPTSQNGLFRLSQESSTTPTGTGPQSWTLTGATVTSSTSTPVTINRVKGLPSNAGKSQPHKYLIETNPVLTDLKQFMSSDYLLSNLGYDPDQSAKRLGDGLYEQRLIQQAVVARTGQRFIDGQTSDEGLFKYLMNNAIASKQELNLSLGVSLTSEQVAALTHDIVWMENAEVNGEQVLVPVLYLANANNRLAANGALIQGSDVTLIAGKDLNNAGTLRASNNLSATAGNDLVNSGLVEAGNRLDLLAGNNLTNKAGGIIAGRDVSVAATRGDVINERTVTTHESSSGYRSERTDFVDNAARIEAANSLTINAGRDINNVGGVVKSGADTTITAGRDVNLTSAERIVSGERGRHRDQTITQYGSDVDVGRDLKVNAGRDITAIASQIEAKRDVSMSAVGDLTLASAADEQHSYSKTKKVTSQEDHVRQVSTTVTAGGNVALSAGQDLKVTASRVNAGNEAYVYAGNDLSLNTAENSDYSYYSKTKKGSWGKKKSTMTESGNEEAVSSVIQAEGKTTLVAVNDINITGSTVNSDKGALEVLAGNDVNLNAAQNSQFSASAKSKSGGFGLSSTSKMSSDSSSSTSLTGSTLSGNTTLVQAGNNLVVSASNVVSTEETNLQARNDIRIESDVEHFSAQHSQSTKKSGLISSGGIGVTLGSSKNTYKQDTESQTQKASTVGSVLGNVNITAGKDLTVKASDVVAGKDISLIGKNVRIIDAASDSSTRTSQESKKSGLTLALSGVVGEAVNTAVQTAQEAKHEDDTRLAALQGIKAGLSGYQAWQGAQALESGAKEGSFVGIALSLGAQKSSSKQVQEQSVSQGSSLTAGNDLHVIATGNGQPGAATGDISVIGSKLQAGHDVVLSAARDIDMRAGANTQKLDGSNKSGGEAVGVSLGVGSSGAGLSIFANANSGTGKEKGNGTVWTETTVNAGNQLTLNSGRDTTLEGAQASAQKVVADIGRNLTMSSLRDSDRFDSKQANVSGGASFTIGSMTGSGSLSVSQDKIKSNFNSVQEQTGLFAGKDGYQVTVGEHTQLNGSVIGSTASADKNKLNTGTLGWTDIGNKADFSSQHQSVSGGTGGDAGSMFMGNMGSMLLVGANNNGHDSSTTYSAVSNGEITIRDKDQQQQDVASLSRDVEHANNALSPIFDKEKEQNRLRQAQLIGDIGNQAMDIIRTQGTIEAAKAQKDPLAVEDARQKLIKEGNTDPSKEQIATQITNTVMQQYGTGSDLQRAAQAVTAAIQGLAGGNIGQAIAGASAPYLAGVIKDSTGDNLEARIMAHALLGAVLAKSQQNSALAGAAGASIGELVASQLYPGKTSDQLTEAEKQKVSALSTLAGGLAGGLVGGSSADAIAGAQASKNAVENNYLSVEEANVKKALTLKEREGTITPEEAQKLADTKKLDKDRDAAIQAACTAGNKAGAECARLVAMAKQALVEYGDSVSYSLLYKDIYPEDSANVEAVLQGLDSESITRDAAITAIVKESGLSRDEIESRYDLVMSLQAATAALAGLYGIRSLSAAAPSTSKGAKDVVPDLDTLRATHTAEIDSVSTFKTYGVDRRTADSYLSTFQGQQLLRELGAADPTADISKIYARAVDQLGSGSGTPKLLTTNSPLVKIVPQGQTVSPYSPFFTTAADLNAASKSGYSLADYFGLPVRSEAQLYDIYQISPSGPATVFVSKVAPTTELGGLVSRPGGAIQYVVPNRASWSLPTHIGTIGN